MRKMFNEQVECNNCGKPDGPPPDFILPPPPIPPTMVVDTSALLSSSNCNEKEITSKMQQVWNTDMCEAMPIFNDSFYSSQSLHTSLIIAFLALLFLLGLLLSTLCVWKNKRKVQSFLSYKSATQGACLNSNLPIGNSCAVIYEDCEAHLVQYKPQHNYNTDYHIQSVHYPSGYPMTRSPPCLDSSSPGPDPYRSIDNIYEELAGPAQDSDVEYEPTVLHSDDDFAEDELSLAGEQPEFNKLHVSTLHATATATPTAAATTTLPADTTAYHECTNVVSSSYKNISERNSVLSASTATCKMANTNTNASSKSNNNQLTAAMGSSLHFVAATCNSSNGSSTTPRHTSSTTTTTSGLLSSILRHATKRRKFHSTHRTRTKIEQKYAYSVDNLNNSAAAKELNGISPMAASVYDDRGHCSPTTLCFNAPRTLHSAASRGPLVHTHSLSHINNNLRGNVRPAARGLDCEIGRRNHINEQLCNAGTHSISTIYRELRRYPSTGSSQRVQQLPSRQNSTMEHASQQRFSHRNGNRVSTTAQALAPRCGYVDLMLEPAKYVNSATTSAATGADAAGRYTYQHTAQLYSPADSSFGSDSGYSQRTFVSSNGRPDCDVTPPPLYATLLESSTAAATTQLPLLLNSHGSKRRSVMTDTTTKRTNATYQRSAGNVLLAPGQHFGNDHSNNNNGGESTDSNAAVESNLANSLQAVVSHNNNPYESTAVQA